MKSSPLMMEGRQSRPMSNVATFIKDVIDDTSSVKSTNPTQQSPLRQVFPSSEDTSSSSPVQQNDRPGSTASSSGKSTVRSSDEKSTHESSDEDSSMSSDDPNEDLSLAEPTTLIDPMSFYTARPDELSTVHTPTESPDESFRTAKQAQTPHPNASSSLNSSIETKSRSVRFAPPNDIEEPSFAFEFTPQLPPSSPDRPTTPIQQNSSPKNTPHNSPLKLFSRYDTFTNNKLEDMVANLLPPPEDEEEETLERERKRARREALSRDRVPRIGGGGGGGPIRSHVRVPSLTTQEMFDDAEDFMRDLRSMPRPTVETPDSAKEESALEDLSVIQELSIVHEEHDFPEEEPQEQEDEEEPEYEEHDDQSSSEFEHHLPPHQYPHHQDYSQHSESEAYDSIRQTPSPGKLLPRSPLQTFSPANPTSRVSSAESMQTIAPHEVKHLIPNKIGSMTYNEAQKLWYKDRPSTLRSSAQTDIPVEDEDEEDIFADIEDLVVSDEDEESLGTGSRPGTAEGEGGLERYEMEQNSFEEAVQQQQEERMSPGGKERGSAQEYPEEKLQQQQQQERNVVIETPASPIAPPKSPLRKSISSPLPSPISSPSHTISQVSSPAKSIHTLPPSPLRKPLQSSTHQNHIPTPPAKPTP